MLRERACRCRFWHGLEPMWSHSCRESSPSWRHSCWTVQQLSDSRDISLDVEISNVLTRWRFHRWHFTGGIACWAAMVILLPSTEIEAGMLAMFASALVGAIVAPIGLFKYLKTTTVADDLARVLATLNSSARIYLRLAPVQKISK